jgi:hypothetical protein
MACSTAAPCNLPTAVNQGNLAGFGRVLMAAGTYNPASTLSVSAGLDIGPEPGAPDPTIHGAASGNVFYLNSPGALLHDVFLTQSGGNTALVVSSGAVAERVDVTTSGSEPACSPSAGTLRDSVCRATGSGPNASGIWVVPPAIAPSTGNLLNVTAIGNRSGLQLIADVAGEVMTLNATNVIAQGGVSDIVTQPSGGGVTRANLASSNYESLDTSAGGSITPPGSGGNQTATPLFADAAGGDLHQLPGSPTIDAGSIAAGLGALDADRHSRVQSACVGGVAVPDIGAYEVSPPTAAASCSGFTIAGLQLVKKKGIGKLTVKVPGSGQLSESGKGVKRVTASSSAAGSLVVKVKAKGKKLKALNRKGKVKLNISLAWAPTGNPGSTQTDKIKLKKK